ncbi:serine hydrolase [Actinomadura sp. J1-007]|uniref:serine hydrolase domain-containing protein n=1 Tax=Actinomadura sp. J1-007 TaxID=2661913 RepID=UPI00132BB7CD|nr:serine hydrolase domain-containing protein [Actinomadura sp. J1-007]MWK39961.1 serine hydrolase [Actinomadura sp. J1-007]
MRFRRLATMTMATTALCGLAPTFGPAFVPAARASSTPLQRELDGAVRDTGMPGAIMTRAGRAEVTVRSGVGDVRTGRPVPRHAMVRVGSTTKAFVATVVLQLVGEGRVALDAPVETYLPGVVRGRGGDGRTITVRQLLQHTSGLPDPGTLLPSGRAWAERRFRHRDRGELIRYALSLEPTTARWSYTNTGYLLLGELIEKVTKARSWRDEVARRIVRPLGLRHTYSPEPSEYRIRGPHPRGYLRAPGLIDVTEQDTGYLDAAGDMVSTPAEIDRFFGALLRDGCCVPPCWPRCAGRSPRAAPWTSTGSAWRSTACPAAISSAMRVRCTATRCSRAFSTGAGHGGGRASVRPSRCRSPPSPPTWTISGAS